MNLSEAEEFLERMARGLKEEFTIPRKTKEEVEEEAESERQRVAAAAAAAAAEAAAPQNPSGGYGKRPHGGQRRDDDDPPAQNAKVSKPDPPRSDGDRAGVQPPAPLTYGQVRGGWEDRHGLSSWRSAYDKPLPDDLLALCGEAKCGLCGVDFTSAVVAKSHYVGKSHSKKAGGFLTDWSRRTQREAPAKKLKCDVVVRQDETFCAVCRLELSSKIVAMTHYHGRRHAARVRSGVGAAPAEPKAIQSDDDDKVGTEGQEQQQGRRSFCLPCKAHFTTAEEYAAHVASGGHRMKAALQVEERPPAAARPNDLRCSICDLQCDGEKKYDDHMAGKKHRNKASWLQQKEGGSFRCELCMIRATDQNSLELHYKGKKHLKKAAQQEAVAN